MNSSIQIDFKHEPNVQESLIGRDLHSRDVPPNKPKKNVWKIGNSNVSSVYGGVKTFFIFVLFSPLLCVAGCVAWLNKSNNNSNVIEYNGNKWAALGAFVTMELFFRFVFPVSFWLEFLLELYVCGLIGLNWGLSLEPKKN